MRKILHVVPSISKASGVMSFLMNLYRNIDRSEYQFDVLYIIKTPITYQEEIENLGGNSIYISKPNILNLLSFYHKVDGFFKSYASEYSAIHLHEVLVGPIMLPLAEKYGIHKRIIHSHNSVPSEKPLRAWRNNLLCFPLKRLSNIWLACSEKAGIFLYGNKSMNAVKIVNNGIDLTKYTFNKDIREKTRALLNIDSKTLVIGHVGRFNDQKNHVHLIKTIEALSHQRNDFVVILVGNGPKEEYIRNKVSDMGLNKYLRFLGIRSDIDRLLQAMDVFILPSLFEGLPIAGVEAQASGLPCVFSDTITKEANVTGNVTYLPLSISHEEWAKSISQQYIKVPRVDTSAKMRNAGFDIVQLVEEMAIIYS